MGGSHTQVIVDHAWRAIFGNWHASLIGPVNEDSRKVGHFFGYGTIGLLFRRAWHASMRAWALTAHSRLALFSASLGIACTFAVASLDEWHQRFLRGRVGSFHDVLLDTCGALCLNLLLFAYRAHKREQACMAA
jgi:VanZ family protein